MNFFLEVALVTEILDAAEAGAVITGPDSVTRDKNNASFYLSTVIQDSDGMVPLQGNSCKRAQSFICVSDWYPERERQTLWSLVGSSVRTLFWPNPEFCQDPESSLLLLAKFYGKKYLTNIVIKLILI